MRLNFLTPPKISRCVDDLISTLAFGQDNDHFIRFIHSFKPSFKPPLTIPSPKYCVALKKMNTDCMSCVPVFFPVFPYPTISKP